MSDFTARARARAEQLGETMRVLTVRAGAAAELAVDLPAEMIEAFAAAREEGQLAAEIAQALAAARAHGHQGNDVLVAAVFALLKVFADRTGHALSARARAWHDIALRAEGGRLELLRFAEELAAAEAQEAGKVAPSAPEPPPPPEPLSEAEDGPAPPVGEGSVLFPPEVP